jgi:pimeloyl-ACP methyl ester carboxylesterase
MPTRQVSGGWLRSAVATIAVALALVFVFARATRAQERPVVFQHGVVSNGQTWDGLATALRRELLIVPLQPSLAWWQGEQDQADALAAALNAGPYTGNDLLVVGHSNGGIVGREYTRRGGRASSIITVGTPHRGAPFANAWLSGEIGNDARFTARTIADPVMFFYQYDWEQRLPQPAVLAAGAFVDFMWDIGRFLCGGLGICNVRTTEALAPVIRQLASDYSAYIANLNSAANLGSEHAQLSYRAGISSTFQPINAFCYLVTSVADICVTTRAIGIVSFLQAYQLYADHEDIFLAANAYRWLNGAAALIDMDAMWEEWVGALVHYRRVIDAESGFAAGMLAVLPNDGFLPEYTTQYVNPTRSHVVLPGNISHTMQTSSDALRTQLRSMFADELHIPERKPGAVASVRITPDASTLLIGQTLQLFASAHDVDGHVVPASGFTWSSSDNSRAVVSSTGLVTGLGAGTAIISVAADGYTASASVTMTSRAVE